MDAGRALLNFAGGLPDRALTRIPDFLLRRNEVSRDEYLERLRFYAQWPTERGFFVLPEDRPVAELVERRAYGDGERVLFRYRSRFAGHNPAMREALGQIENNQNAYLHVWRHDASGRRPLVLCVHGFGMIGPQRAEQMFKVEGLFARGMDVALYHLPLHWRRSHDPRTTSFLRPQDLPFTLEEWARNIHDLHSGLLHLRDLGYARVGLIGASLGGLTGALYATSTTPAVDFVFLVVPATDLSNFLKPRASRMKFRVDDDVTALSREAIKRITPAQYTPSFDVSRMAIVAHEGDRICPVADTRRLVARWGIEHYTEVVGGHWVYLDRKVRGRTWHGWLQQQGFVSG